MHPSWMIWNPIEAFMRSMDVDGCDGRLWVVWALITFMVALAFIAVMVRVKPPAKWGRMHAFIAGVWAAAIGAMWPLTWFVLFLAAVAGVIGVAVYGVSQILLVPSAPQPALQLPEPDPYLSIAQREVNAIAPDQQ